MHEHDREPHQILLRIEARSFRRRAHLHLPPPTAVVESLDDCRGPLQNDYRQPSGHFKPVPLHPTPHDPARTFKQRPNPRGAQRRFLLPPRCHRRRRRAHCHPRDRCDRPSPPGKKPHPPNPKPASDHPDRSSDDSNVYTTIAETSSSLSQTEAPSLAWHPPFHSPFP
jgi:hypothetical protein